MTRGASNYCGLNLPGKFDLDRKWPVSLSMRTNRIYYGLKPYLPLRLRMAVRRAVARWRRKACENVWPIKESAGQRPADWMGWPDGKKFALVLTHDVETACGLAKCRQLMQLETQMGFRSSFNFIPEGDYRVSGELMEEMRGRGFEVGVQDLKHDGKLFRNREAFRDGALQINRYLHAWDARGFRSGFMFHNLDWAHDLDIDYSSCTFDTDPFEPQPDDVDTIFPFWVPRRTNANGRNGYVELPYTLPQDSTLFLLLQERQPDIWIRKLDWIAEHGGMVLLNTHPDYMAMNSQANAFGEYPMSFYRQFLDYVRANYAGMYWQALPREVAAHVSDHQNDHAQNRVESRNGLSGNSIISLFANESSGAKSVDSKAGNSVPFQIVADSQNDSTDPESAVEPENGAPDGGNLFEGRRAAVVLFSEYPADPRPRRAAEALARQGMSVDVFCLQGGPEEPKRETVDGVNVFRLSLKRRRGGKGAYMFQYGAFILAAFAFLSRRSLWRRYHLVHVHNMPDVLVFSALVPRILGAKIILDLHDPMPELMMTIFKLSPASRVVRLLKLFEKWSTGFADLVMTVNEASKRIYTSRSCVPEKVHVVMNSPDEQIFGFVPVSSRKCGNGQSNKPFVIMYHGSIFSRNGLDLAVDALELTRRSVPGATMIICGDNNAFLEEVMSSVKTRGLQNAVTYLGKRNLRQIAEAIDTCDIGVIPNRRNTFTEMNTPTRIFEYLARGKAVIAPKARGIEDYFGPEDILYFELGDAADLARKIEYAFFHPDETEQITSRGQKVYLAHRWTQEKAGFVNAAARLSGRGRPGR
jgi:glycosyltransferase involved in cell wall biosynthesis